MILRKILIALTLLITIALAVIRTLPPHALPANAPAEQFSAGRAIEVVKVIAESPRLVGSPVYETARSYLLGQLRALGLKAEFQDAHLSGKLVENIVGRLDGRSSSAAILLIAHIDSVENSPGASDDASGIAAILETIRALRTGPPLENTLLVLFTGPEEDCCYGAKAFATQHPWAKDVRLVINLDAGGLDGPSILAATASDTGWMIRELSGVLPDPIASSAIEALGSPATDYTLALRPAGFVGYDFNLSWNKAIHSPRDNIDNVNLASLQHQGEHLLAVARHFGNRDLSLPPEPKPIYFDILSLGLIWYPTTWAIPLLCATSLALGYVLWLGFYHKILTWRGLGLGLAWFLLSLLTVPSLLLVVQAAIGSPTPQLAADLVGVSTLSDSIRWGTLIMAPTATLLWATIFRKRKWLERESTASGASLFLYLAAFGTSLWLPALSYLFIWPLLASLGATVIRFTSKNPTGWLPGLVTLFAAVVALVLFVPGVLIALFGVDIRSIYLVPIFVIALLGYLAPPVEIFLTGSD